MLKWSIIHVTVSLSFLYFTLLLRGTVNFRVRIPITIGSVRQSSVKGKTSPTVTFMGLASTSMEDTEDISPYPNEGTHAQLQSWTKVSGHFCISGAFSIFTQVQPLPSPHKQYRTRVSRIFPVFQPCIGWGKGELREISKRMHRFKREPRNDRKI